MPSRQQLKQLQLALINAFPSKSSLERLLYYELEKNLNEITKDSDLQDIVFNVIQTAESQGWLEELIRAAHKENSGNSLLEAITRELLNPKIPVVPTNIPYQPIIQLAFNTQRSSTLVENTVKSAQESEVDADYTALKEFLQQQRFKEADFETTRKMLWIARRLTDQRLFEEDFQNFPLLDLITIDKLWLTGSNDKFGFSIQKQIWSDKGGNVGAYNAQKQKFSSFVKELEWEKDDIPYDLRAKKGYLPRGIYCITREETEKIRGQYLNEYNEFFNRHLEEERNLARRLRRLGDHVNHVVIQGDHNTVTIQGDHEEIPPFAPIPYLPEAYFFFLHRLLECNL